jgi:hypothetical protein
MSGDEGEGAVPPEWLQWMRDFRALAERIAFEEDIEVDDLAEQELLSIKAALYAGIVTLFGTLILLAEHDHQLDLRIHSRALVEAAMYMIALDTDPALLGRMKDDHKKSRLECQTALNIDPR